MSKYELYINTQQKQTRCKTSKRRKMKNKIILIAGIVSVTSTVFAKVHALNCIVGSAEKLQMVSIVVDESKAEQGLGKITLSNLDKVEGWKPFERAETPVEAQYTVDSSTGEKNIIGATVNMGKSGLVSIKPIAVMNGSIYAELTVNTLGLSYPENEKALCVRPEVAAQ